MLLIFVVFGISLTFSRRADHSEYNNGDQVEEPRVTPKIYESTYSIVQAPRFCPSGTRRIGTKCRPVNKT